MDVFSHYAPFIQDYIYEHGWQNLRPIQVAAAEEIFETEDNVLFQLQLHQGKQKPHFSRSCQISIMNQRIRSKRFILRH